jgi:hypothetical protein
MRWRQNLILRRMRGEQVEVPTIEEEDLQPVTTPDSAAGDTGVVADSILPDTAVHEPAPSDSTAPPPAAIDSTVES